MARIISQKAYGDAVITRLASAPARVKEKLTAFKTVHQAYSAAYDEAAAADFARTAALAAVTAADDTQDASIDTLADAAVSAGVGTRLKPLAKFTNSSPSDLKELATATEAKTIGEITQKILASAPPAALKTAALKAKDAAGQTHAALEAATNASSAHAEAAAKRDGLLPAWTLALNRLKKEAAAAWSDEPARVKAAFAPVPRIAAPKRKSPKKPAPPKP